MPAFICTTCGTQYPPAETAPATCAICEDERQYVGHAGQGWTTQEKLALTHFNAWHEYEPGIIGIGTQPRFAIGQRALLLRTAHGNVLWDCISMLDAATVTLIKALGGIQAMAISHPHFYTSMAEWTRAFDVPVHIHAADRQWIIRPEGNLKLWEGETLELLPDVTLIRGGGHFSGSSMLHWAKGAAGRGVLCASDTAYVAADQRHVSFMRSYPNLLPLPAQNVQRIAAALAPFAFDMMFGNFFESVIRTGAKEAVQKSVERYLAAIAPDAAFEPPASRKIFFGRCRNGRTPSVFVAARHGARPIGTRSSRMQYLLMIYGNEAGMQAASKDQATQMSAAYAAYTQAMQKAGVVRGGERLRPTSEATTVRVNDGKTQVLDGPYADTKEQLGGFYLIDVPDLDAALSWAAKCPGAAMGTMEVRPIWPMQ